MLGHVSYAIVVCLVILGLYIVMANSNLVKKLLGLGIFQSAVFVFYISLGVVERGTAPIWADDATLYSNPLPHVLILTAIVVGVATLALGLALVVRLHRAYDTIEEDEIARIEREDAR